MTPAHGGDDRLIRDLRLLEALEAHGSINAAAEAAGMGYRSAWNRIERIANLSTVPLLERRTGGRRGGGTRLTPAGQQLLTAWRRLAEEQARLGEAGGTVETDTEALALTRRLALRTSARNQIFGRVTRIRSDAVEVEVCLTLADGTQEIASVITAESLRELGIREGDGVHALIKASTVMIATDVTAVSARNRLSGRVARVVPGTVNAEVVIEIPGGQTIAATITRDSVERLGLAPGVAATALFKASSVILGI
ncbi:TOBE domain-containing protein [Arhodomonas aquaeolei]|uniref:TOBE domain-containing protein n=1 Tax=Arhodomonas aquaeolei TaxID=2369 RepID=UPI000371ACBE|nr:TOBE domain-containing protein [Arhodomonas aquaeolei]